MLQPRFAVLALSILVLAGCGEDATETAAEPVNQNQYITQGSFATLEEAVAQDRTALNNLDTQVKGVASIQATQGQQLTNIDTKLTNIDTKLTNFDTRIIRDSGNLKQQIEELKAHTSQPYGGSPTGSASGGTPTPTAPPASATPSSDPGLSSWGQSAASAANDLEQLNRAAGQAVQFFETIDKFRSGSGGKKEGKPAVAPKPDNATRELIEQIQGLDNRFKEWLKLDAELNVHIREWLEQQSKRKSSSLAPKPDVTSSIEAKYAVDPRYRDAYRRRFPGG